MKLDLPREHEFDAAVWYSTCASTWYPAHWHDELELNVVLWGSAVYEIGRERVELRPSSLLWLAPGQEHRLLDVSDDLAMWVASFRPFALREAEKLSGVRLLAECLTWGVCPLPAASVSELSALHASLAHCATAREVNLLARRLLACALDAWREQRDAQAVSHEEVQAQSRRLHEAVARARMLLRAPGEAPSLSTLSRYCGLEAGRLSRLFKQQMGLSVVQFRNHFRVQQFIAQLGRGETATMLGAALGSGFGSYPQFHRAFHQVTGYAPSEHLRRVRAGIVFPVHQHVEPSASAGIR
jgi:AraC-like DNA-binding protein